MIKKWVYDDTLSISYNTVTETMWHMVFDNEKTVRFIFLTDGITYTKDGLFCSKDYQDLLERIKRLKLICDPDRMDICKIERVKNYFLMNGKMRIDNASINNKEKFITLIKKGAAITI